MPGVVLVAELVQHPALALRLHLEGQVTGSFHPLFPGDCDNFRTIGAHGCPTLLAHVGGHDQHHAVTLDRSRHGQSDAGVATGRLDQGIAGFDLTPALRFLDHADSWAVLYRAGRVIPLQLGQNHVTGLAGETLQANQGSVPDIIFNGGKMHMITLWYTFGFA